MKRTSTYLAHSVMCDKRADGSLLLSSNQPLSDVVENTSSWLHLWATKTPQQVFLAERDGAGWREESYASVLKKVRSIASGIPTVPVAEQYSLIPGAQARLQHVINLVKPKIAYVDDAQQYRQALQLSELSSVEVVASRNNTAVTAFDDLLKNNASYDVTEAHTNNVHPETVIKILMTSGSTSAPKGVLTTNKMVCANAAQTADVLPFLRQRPPRIVDWLPWNHVFGGSANFYMMLANGGSIYIDTGKPVKDLFDKTIENLRLMTGTLCFNVPAGYQMLLTALRKDEHLRHRFFTDLDLIFYAGASLPQNVWEGFESMAMEVKGEVPLMTSSWGLTETAPACLMQQEPTSRSGIVGVPLPDLVAKLIPESEDRFEIRVKGPNVMPGYFDAPQQTASAFDDDGFFITGDAMKFVDPDNPNQGLRFDGRLSEDFKLLSGTWVRSAQLRMDMLACLAPLVADVVVTGADKDDIGLLIFPNMAQLKSVGVTGRQQDGLFISDELNSELLRRLTEHAQNARGSSTRVARALVMSEQPSIKDAEITAKGNLNFRQVLTRRADLLKLLYNGADPAVITL